MAIRYIFYIQISGDAVSHCNALCDTDRASFLRTGKSKNVQVPAKGLGTGIGTLAAKHKPHVTNVTTIAMGVHHCAD